MNKELVFLLEEKSARTMLEAIIEKMVKANSSIKFTYLVFEGKRDLDKKLNGKLKGYCNLNAAFIILRDKDSSNCTTLKKDMLDRIPDNKKKKSLIRIACHELESFYFGDLAAVSKGLNMNLQSVMNKSKYRTPDTIVNPSAKLATITKEKYKKISSSRSIAPHLVLDGSNKSHSFNVLIVGIKKQIESLAQI